jgi:hypothetical protein
MIGVSNKAVNTHTEYQLALFSLGHKLSNLIIMLQIFYLEQIDVSIQLFHHFKNNEKRMVLIWFLAIDKFVI